MNCEIRKPLNERTVDITEATQGFLEPEGFFVSFGQQEIADKKNPTAEEVEFLEACQLLKNPGLFTQFFEKYYKNEMWWRSENNNLRTFTILPS